MEEKKYPIYSFSARWSQDGKWDGEYPKWHEGLPEGRIWNSTGFSKIYKEEKTQEELDAIAKEWWERMISRKEKDEKHPIINPELDHLKAEYKENEVWVLTWFQHETFDVGQTDEEALESFQNYVDRVQANNEKIERSMPEDEWYKNGYKTLMGAEDRWRWRGANEKGEYSEDAPAPCRCKFCKEQGLLRIAH